MSKGKNLTSHMLHFKSPFDHNLFSTISMSCKCVIDLEDEFFFSRNVCDNGQVIDNPFHSSSLPMSAPLRIRRQIPLSSNLIFTFPSSAGFEFARRVNLIKLWSFRGISECYFSISIYNSEKSWIIISASISFGWKWVKGCLLSFSKH